MLHENTEIASRKLSTNIVVAITRNTKLNSTQLPLQLSEAHDEEVEHSHLVVLYIQLYSANWQTKENK